MWRILEGREPEARGTAGKVLGQEAVRARTAATLAHVYGFGREGVLRPAFSLLF